MEKLSPVEVRVKILVDAFLSDEISRAKFRRELLKEKVQLRQKKQRMLPKTEQRTFS